MSTVRKPWVAYVGPFPYPEGAAASQRVFGISQSLVLAGYEVVVVSGAGKAGTSGKPVSQVEGIAYVQLPERIAEHWPRPLRRLRYAWMGGRTLEWLQTQPVPPAAVILYSGYTPYLQRLMPWCRRHKVPLLFDAVEWYEPDGRLGYLTSPYQWNIEWAMRRLIPKLDGVIAISSYLAEHYRQRGLPVALVPPTTSRIGNDQWQPDDTLRLCYAGAPGAGKDDLRAVLQAVGVLANKGVRIRLTVAGPCPEEVLRMCGGNVSGCPSWLALLGHLPQATARELVATSDFSILLRRPSRVAQAGFSTKFVESVACGTPVICNLTSDLGHYLRDGENGFVCDSMQPDSVVAAIERAAMLSLDEMRAMRGAALAMAREAFHPGRHAEAMRSLLSSVIQNGGRVKCRH